MSSFASIFYLQWVVGIDKTGCAPPATTSAPPPAWPSPPGPTRTLGNPEPPRRRLEYPREGAEGEVAPQDDGGSTGEPEGRNRGAPGGAWSQLSEEARDELTRPLRVESGHTG